MATHPPSPRSRVPPAAPEPDVGQVPTPTPGWIRPVPLIYEGLRIPRNSQPTTAAVSMPSGGIHRFGDRPVGIRRGDEARHPVETAHLRVERKNTGPRRTRALANHRIRGAPARLGGRRPAAATRHARRPQRPSSPSPDHNAPRCTLHTPPCEADSGGGPRSITNRREGARVPV